MFLHQYPLDTQVRLGSYAYELAGHLGNVLDWEDAAYHILLGEPVPRFYRDRLVQEDYLIEAAGHLGWL